MIRMNDPEKRSVVDITRSLAPGITVWPGDQPFTRAWSARIGDDSSVNVGRVTMSTHTGTHVDAPLHFLSDGEAVDDLPLEAFVGPAWVVDVEDTNPIAPEHVRDVDLKRYPRVLFKTRSSNTPNDRWDPDFAVFLPETIDVLGRHGVRLIGTDAPSVDPAESKTLPVHHALAQHGIVNLENLCLRDVKAGAYVLVALPVKLAGMDAAPVRAVLLPAL